MSPQEAHQLRLPNERATSKYTAFSLMRPQDLAFRMLPAPRARQLREFATVGCPAECGDPWPPHVLEAARAVGPHQCALSKDSVNLVWEDISYQEAAGFGRVMTEEELFGTVDNSRIKISRVAVVPQVGRRDRIILNLSAKVAVPASSRRKRKSSHPSVNETTAPAEDQEGVKALGTVKLSILKFMFETDCTWEIDWHKIDLSDGFWRMIVESGKEYEFVYEMPERQGDTCKHYFVPSALQMGWQNSPAFFCTATEAVRTLTKRVLAVTQDKGILEPHQHEKACFPEHTQMDSIPVGNHSMESSAILMRVFVDDFTNGIAGPPDRPERQAEQLWFSRAVLHSIHAIFPPPKVLHHDGGKDSISEKKLNKGDARFKMEETLIGFIPKGGSHQQRTVALPSDKVQKYVEAAQSVLGRNFLPQSVYAKVHGKLQYASGVMPCMRGYMTPLNRALSSSKSTVGIGKTSGIREALEQMVPMLRNAQSRPSHITEIVPPDLPHVYGYVDFAACGFGGV